jgi:hypothetical protein
VVLASKLEEAERRMGDSWKGINTLLVLVLLESSAGRRSMKGVPVDGG